ncbi:hypothetical protein Lesp02_57090 [Lentzea sp. NBRC 105346]|uniref:sialidase family protein n=1 Tax=Lentzea sp. NBRC 105346 TaxID=3032205 RepID=UPI0024A19013|nr:sialidase family protein [Lentzea sp. NBRC 105346]GLZ33521.1 hypothetical protein Lesp02_57090 [Lentzea sp. NBRC 105346]
MVKVAVMALALALTPTYGPVSVEAQDPGYQYRSMPALQYVSYTEAGQTKQRFVRSFQISKDDGSLVTRVQYHVGGQASMTDTNNWKPALDATTGRELLYTTPYAKMNNTYRTATGATATIDEQVQDGHLMRRVSTDGGVSWRSYTAALDMSGGAYLGGGRAFQRVIRLPDQSLVMPFYAAHATGRYASHLLVSTNDGASWKRAATVFKSDTNTYSESSVARRADGHLVMISRYDVVLNGKRIAHLGSRTTNGPVNDAASLATAAWGPLKAVVVPGAADETVVQGVAPVLHTMDQGVLMLVFGRPRNKITFSHDGGATWSAAHSFYDNIPTAGCTDGQPAGDGTFMPCSSLGSSGYTGVAVTSPRTAYIMGDNCHTNWGCAGDYSYPHGRDDKLWYSTVVLS